MTLHEQERESVEAICRRLQTEEQSYLDKAKAIAKQRKLFESGLNSDPEPPIDKEQAEKPQKRTVTQEDVRAEMIRLVQITPGIAVSKLKKDTEEQLRAKELDLKGYVNRCREVLEREPFTVTADGRVHLTSEPKPQSARPVATVTRPEPKLPVERTAPSPRPALLSRGESRQSETA